MLLAWICVLLASVPATMFAINAFWFRRLRPVPANRSRPLLSVLIPARDEEASIGDAVRSVLGSTGVQLELLVLDDGSSDRTPALVAEIASRDSRLSLIAGPPLPVGWNGKQHACFMLAQAAQSEYLCFLDADVRLTPDALARMLDRMEEGGLDLLSGFPRQITDSLFERLLIPLIHFVLLGFLPIPGLRRTRHPAFSAGCGQLMMVRRAAYMQCGGHSALKLSMHDGLRLPRAFREAGFPTDIFDATDVASVRMYAGARGTWFGLAKNAVEGLAAPQRLPLFTVLLGGGQILPFVLVGAGVGGGVAAAAAVLSLLPRFWAAVRFRQSLLASLLHPFGVSVLLVLQWWALLRYLSGKPATWKDRAYTTAVSSAE